MSQLDLPLGDSEPDQPEPPPTSSPEYRQVAVEHLACRVYPSGHVVIASRIQNPVDPHASLELEISTDTKIARDFFERAIGMINQAEGRY